MRKGLFRDPPTKKSVLIAYKIKFRKFKHARKEKMATEI
jgi:hypothetical protein